MEAIRQRFYEKYALTQTKRVRGFMHTIDWQNRFIGIKGSRGVGKTTLLLQFIKQNYKPDQTAIYVSLDNLYFTENRLYDFADLFYKKGGELLAIDEVHRYPDWALELKNIYDDMPGLRVIFTGSSLLHLHKAKADLSRRVVMYEMPGLSFREFIFFTTGQDFSSYPLADILDHHVEIAITILKDIKPLAWFDNYLNYGYYPFFLENKRLYHQKLYETLLTVLEVDIPQIEFIQTANIIYLKKLLKIISNSVPFKPNMNALSSRTGISLNTLKTYLKYLNDANLLSLLYFPDKGVNSLNKPEKIYLENTNLIYNLADTEPNTGNLRETFFFNQVSKSYNIQASRYTDFIVNGKYNFEIGCKTKQRKQISNLKNAYVVKDNIEVGSENIIPLWLFGFLY